MWELIGICISHGSLVEAHLRGLLESAGFSLRSSKPLKYGWGERTVTLSRLDLGEVYQTKSIGATPLTPSAALAQALGQKLASENKGIKPGDLVLNRRFTRSPARATGPPAPH